MPRNSEVNFNLKFPKGITKQIAEKNNIDCLIFLNFKYSKQRLFYSFGEKIKFNDWNEDKQRAKIKKKFIFTADGEHSLNDLLDNLKETCENAYKFEKANGIPSPNVLKKYLDDFLKKNKVEDDSKPTLYKLIERFTAGEIKYQGRDKTAGTVQTYKSTLKHLQEFEAKEKYKIDFDTITLDFYYKFLDYLNKAKNKKTGEKIHGLNNVGKQVKNIKVFMNEAIDLGYTTNMQFKNKKFITPSEETEGVYLNENEILKLYKHDFSDNKRLEQVRDLFIFGCCVGLRFSDFSDVKEENIVEMEGDLFIKLITKKTKERVIIPCHELVLDIFKKYQDSPNKLPRTISNQKFNEYIKEACAEAKMNEKGRLFKQPSKELSDCIESRTARRSFATNLYMCGYEVHEIMKITGHKTEKAFFIYIKSSKLDSAKRLNAFMKKRWLEKMYKINENKLHVA